MLAVKGIFNGKEVKLLETVPYKKGSKVIVTFIEGKPGQKKYFSELYGTIDGDSNYENIKSVEYRIKD